MSDRTLHPCSSFVRARLVAAMVAGAAIVASAAPRDARAQSNVGYASFLTPADPVVLGPGVSAVLRQQLPCIHVPCGALWDPVGFSFGDQHAALVRANTFVRGPGNRIFGSVDTRLFYTDDLGAHWNRARWEGGAAPLAMAFDGPFGAAVGDNGTVFTTEDGGLTWRSRRDASGVRNVAVAVLAPRVVVWSDANGGVFASLDGGFSPRTLVEPNRAAMIAPTANGAYYGAPTNGMLVARPVVTAPAFRVERGAIWVPGRAGWFRVDPRDGVMTVRAETP